MRAAAALILVGAALRAAGLLEALQDAVSESSESRQSRSTLAS